LNEDTKLLLLDGTIDAVIDQKSRGSKPAKP